jgi:hypothetical protein
LKFVLFWEAGAPKEEIENAQNEAVFYHKKKDKARVLYDDGKQRLDSNQFL